jgi:hypothetical protein
MSIKFMGWIKKCNWAKDYRYIAILAVTIISIGALALLDDYLCQSINGFGNGLEKLVTVTNTPKPIAPP